MSGDRSEVIYKNMIYPGRDTTCNDEMGNDLKSGFILQKCRLMGTWRYDNWKREKEKCVNLLWNEIHYCSSSSFSI